MIKNISFRILPELKLIIEHFYGSFGVDDYINLKIAQLNDSQFDPLYGNIADIRNSDLSIVNYDIKRCIEFMKSEKGLAAKRRAAVITATPDHVVISTLFTRYGIELPMQYEIVSTLGAAIEWTKVSQTNYATIENVLREMRECTKVNQI